MKILNGVELPVRIPDSGNVAGNWNHLSSLYQWYDSFVICHINEIIDHLMEWVINCFLRKLFRGVDQSLWRWKTIKLKIVEPPTLIDGKKLLLYVFSNNIYLLIFEFGFKYIAEGTLIKSWMLRGQFYFWAFEGVPVHITFCFCVIFLQCKTA